MLTWRNKAFQVCQVEGGIQSHMVDDNGVIIFRWRMHYQKPGDVIDDDQLIYEEFNVPFGVVEHFETFKALCRQFDTPGDARAWLLKKVALNDRKQICK